MYRHGDVKMLETCGNIQGKKGKQKVIDRNMKVGGQTERQTQSFQSDRHNPSVSQTLKGKRRFKASVVDTSAVSPRTVSL